MLQYLIIKSSFIRIATEGFQWLNREGNTGIDHIHILVSIPPKYSVATIAGYLKGKSAMIVFEKYSNLRKNFKGHNFWARGYYVSTVGLDEAKVRKYIKEQEMKETIEDKYDSDLSNA